MCTNEQLKRIEQQARVVHPKVWSKVMMHCTAPIIKMYLDENIKQLERDRKIPQLSDPWVNFLQGSFVSAVAGGKSLRETLMDEFDPDDDASQGGQIGRLAHQDMVALKTWLAGVSERLRVVQSSGKQFKLKSTPQSALNRYFTEEFLHKATDPHLSTDEEVWVNEGWVSARWPGLKINVVVTPRHQTFLPIDSSWSRGAAL